MYSTLKQNGTDYTQESIHLTQKPISDDEYRTGTAELNKKTFEIAAVKQAHYRVHYEKTLALVGEIVRAMARKTVDLYERDAI
jgi:hypothetical protein